MLLEDGLTVGGKPLKDTFEALGHAQAYDFMFTLLDSHRITEADALTMHRMFYTGIDAKEAGHYRDRPVFITGSRHRVCNVKLIGQEMAKLFQWVAEDRDKYHPVKFAAQLHKRFVFIHPYYRRQWSNFQTADEYGSHSGRLHAGCEPAGFASGV